jgi:hypothetical protein
MDHKMDRLDHKVDRLDLKVNQLDHKVDRLELKVDVLQQSVVEKHIENIEAANKLLLAIQTTNDRLDFQRDKLSKTEEEIYLLKHKQLFVQPSFE